MPAPVTIHFAIGTALLLMALPVRADSGGPYEFVPDLSADEKPPINTITGYAPNDLEFFCLHEPRLIWNVKLGEPTKFEWVAQSELAASIDVLSDDGGSCCAVRYMSRKKLEDGLPHTSAVLILVRCDPDHEGKRLFRPAYLTMGGNAYDHSVTRRNIAGLDCIQVVRHYEGTGGITQNIFLLRDHQANEAKLRRIELEADHSVIWKTLADQGYQPWHRGHWTEWDKLISYSQVYKPKAKPDEKSHSRIKVTYRLSGEKLEIEKWEFTDEHQK